MWNFNGTYLGSGGHFSYYSEFKNNWNFSTNLIFHSGAIDPRLLRGGPKIMLPFILTEFGSATTDQSKKIILSFAYSYETRGLKSASSYYLGPGISIRPVQALKIGMTASIINNKDILQYITSLNYLSQKRYIFGTIDQKTLGLTFRIDLNISPEFSIQYYGSPYISRGSYSDFKRITDPRANKFNDRFELYANKINTGDGYGFDENGDMAADYYIGNPDFNFHQFRSNLVAKWEYRLGSFIYLVWSSERTGYSNSSSASVSESLKEMKKVFPNNVFLIKLNYWFSL
jgi:hypothetical protein